MISNAVTEYRGDPIVQPGMCRVLGRVVNDVTLEPVREVKLAFQEPEIEYVFASADGTFDHWLDAAPYKLTVYFPSGYNRIYEYNRTFCGVRVRVRFNPGGEQPPIAPY